ncbi:MAG: PAS domain S-box protein [Rhodocyclaceae bacterium]|nr:PAS domain S-box protein [Rhodocyclaceae bacterium]
MAILIVTAGILVAASIRQDFEEVLATEYRALERQALQAESQVGGVLRGLNVGLRGLVADQEAAPRLPAQAISQHQLAFLKEFPEVRTVTATDETGHVTAAESIQTPQDLDAIRKFNIAERDYFRFHRDARAVDLERVHISRPFIGVSKRWIVVASRAIRGKNGEFRGVVVTTIIPTFFEPVLREILANDVVDAAAIHNRQGDVLYRLPDPEKHIGKNVSKGAAFQRYLQSDSHVTRYLGTVVTDNLKRVLVFGKVGDSGLDVGISAQYDRVVAKWYPVAAAKAVLYGLFVVLALAFSKELRRRQDARMALSRSEARFRLLFEESPVGFLTSDGEGNIVLMNRAFMAIFGYEPGEIKTMSEWRQTIQAEQQGAVRDEEVEPPRHKAAETTRQFEEVVTCKDGATKTVLMRRLHLGDDMLLAVVDISERKQAEELLKDREELLNTMSSMTHTGGWVFDPVSGQGHWTRESARIHDLPDDAPIDVAKGMDYYCEEYRDTIRAAVNDVAEKAEPYDLELEIVSATGRRKWVRTIGEPIVEQGKVIKVQGAIQDITRSKAAETELKARNEELERFNRAVIGRELDIIELKKTINTLSMELGREPPYPLAFLAGKDGDIGK